MVTKMQVKLVFTGLALSGLAWHLYLGYNPYSILPWYGCKEILKSLLHNMNLDSTLRWLLIWPLMYFGIVRQFLEE